MSRTIKKGATSQSLYFDVFDSTSSAGGRKTGLAYNTSNLIAYYCRNGGSATAITLATLAAANSSWSSGGFKEVDATNMPGLYRLDVPDAAFASGSESVVVAIAGATGMVLSAENVQLVDNTTADVYSRIGAPAGASVSADIATVAGYVDTEVAAIKAKTDQITFTIANQVDVNVVDWKGSAAPAMTGDAYARLGAPAGASVSADVAAVKTDTGTLTTRLTSTRAGLLDHLDADISSRLASGSYTAPDNAGIAAIEAKTNNLPSDPADASDIAAAITSLQSHGDGAWATATGFSTSADITTAVSTIEGYGDTNWSTATGFSTLGSGDVSAAVWDVPMADHIGAGTTGDAIFQAGVHAPSADSKADTILADIAALNDLSAADVTGAVWAGDREATLKSLSIYNPDGIAVHVVSDTDHAALIEQNGTHEAIKVTAAGNDAIHLVGGTGGYGLRLGGDAGGLSAAEIATIDGKADAIQAVTDSLVMTGGKLWVLDDEGNPLPHTNDIPAASDNADAILAATYEGSETVKDHLRLARAALYGKANGLDGTTVHFRDAADAKNRLTATVDSDGNRTAVTTDAT